MSLVDYILGVSLGLAAGALFGRFFDSSFHWGYSLLGPLRKSELDVAHGQVAGRTAMRLMVGTLTSGAACLLFTVGLTFLARRFVSDWPGFVKVWFAGFFAAALVAAILRIRKTRTK
jgi:hypothetical protein